MKRFGHIILLIVLSSLGSKGWSQLPEAIFKTLTNEALEEGKSILYHESGQVFVLNSTNAVEGHLSDVQLTCFDSSLNCQWSTTYGQEGVDIPSAFIFGNDGNIWICGTSLGLNSQGYDVFVLSVSVTGELLSRTDIVETGWDFAVDLELINDDLLIAVNEVDEGNSAKCVLFETADLSHSIFFTGNSLSNCQISDVKVNDSNVVYFACNCSSSSSGEQEGWVKFVSPVGLIQEFEATSEIGQVQLEGLNLIDGHIFLVGTVHSEAGYAGYYSKYSLGGNFVQELGWDIDLPFAFYDVFKNNDWFVLTGYTTFAGAGGKDAFMLFLNGDFDFIGAPTYGTTSDDYFVHAVQNDALEIYAVGTSISSSSGGGDAILLKLEYAAAGDYNQTLLYESSCLQVSVNDLFSSQNRVVRKEVYDILGRELNLNDLKFGHLYIEVSFFESGEVVTVKKIRN